jgi:hypothetical protein
MKSSLVSFSVPGLLFMSVLLWNLAGLSAGVHAAGAPAPLMTVEEQKGEMSDPGKVEERGLSRVPMPGRMAPGGRVLTPGGMNSALTKAECTGLGCKAVGDSSCPEVGLIRERCVCAGGGKGLCIDEVK